MKRAQVRIAFGMILIQLLASMFVFVLVSRAVSGYANPVGALDDRGAIEPSPGQYANYKMEGYKNGIMAWSGWWNCSYLGYVEPDLINMTHTIMTEVIEGSEGPSNGVFWLTVNTTNRWAVDGNHWWKDSWYSLWIETNVGEGSVVHIWIENATIAKSELVALNGRFVDCWAANWTDSTSINTVFFDKLTGLCVRVHTAPIELPFQPSIILNLVSTNIPIGFYSPSHDLGISLEVSEAVRPDEYAFLTVTVHNYGASNEINMEVQLLIDGILINSTRVPFLANGSLVKFDFEWTAASLGIYNITACVSPVAGETLTENNKVTQMVRVPTTPEAKVGVKTGDWIKYDYVITAQSQAPPLPQWLKIEFLGVEGTTATVHVTMHMSDGTEQNQTMTVDIVSGGGASATFSGFVIPSNLMVGDSVYLSGYGTVTIEREYAKTYAGVRRTVLSTSFSQQGVSLTYCWDQQTGVMVEASSSFPQLNMTSIALATETNMWQANTMIYLTPSEDSVQVGDTIIIDVAIKNATDLYTWQIKLLFDPAILNYTNAWYVENHVFAGKEIVAVDPVINETEGSVLYACTLLGQEEPFNGNGTLCQIQFIAISPGKTALSFSGPEDTFLLDFDINEMPTGTIDAHLLVEGLYCDVNNDARIDITDISAAAHAFCSYPGHPRWNAAADINKDGVVNIVDLALIVGNFAKSS